MADLLNEVVVPDSVWDGHEFTSIHAGVIFADLENSVMISSALAPADYSRLINDFQRVMLALIDSLRQQGLPVAEHYVGGDQLALFLYDAEEVACNYTLDGPQRPADTKREEIVAHCRTRNKDLAFSAFKAAVQLKNLWLAESFNTRRVLGYREPLGLGIGMHYGKVYLCNRPDGKRRIEGYAVNLGKRIEGFSRQGLYSRIMLSQECHDILRGAVVKHTQLRQRIFFHRHSVPLELLKGVAQSQCVYELKFYHRLGITTPGDVYAQYDALFAVDRTNSWAYYQLFDHCAYHLKDWARAFELAKTALVANPLDEKVLLDLAKCYMHFGRLRQSANLAEQALILNEQFDLAHEHLMEIAALEDKIEAQIEHCRNMVRLSPDSPVNNMNLGLTLLTAGWQDEGLYHVQEALRVFPEYSEWPKFTDALRELERQGKLPAELAGFIRADAAAG